MTPQDIKIAELEQKINHLTDLYFRMFFNDKQVYQHKSYFNADVYFNKKVSFFGSTSPAGKQTAVIMPTGGAIQDAESRTAIVGINNRLQNLNLLA
jgi:hypothetical protein